MEARFFQGQLSPQNRRWAVFRQKIPDRKCQMTALVPNQTRAALISVIEDNVAKGSEIHTDELHTYPKAFRTDEYTHQTVNHSEGEYATPEGVTTNSIESFFNHLKKSIVGTHTSVSPKHLERYVKV